MKKQVFVLAFVWAFSLFCLFTQAVSAQPQVVRTGIYVLSVGKFDVSTGAYVIDFYLNFECDEASVGGVPCDPDFEFMNGRAATVEKIIDKPANKFYRVQAALAENIDLKNYPFDKHALSIAIEDKRRKANELVFVSDERNSGVDQDVVLVGWELAGWNASAAEHHYFPYREDFSRYAFSISIRRLLVASVTKIFPPILFIVIVGLLALLIEERDKLWTRVGINTSALLACIMFHLNVTSSIPPLGYLTFADKFLLATYVVLVLSLVSTVFMMMHAKRGDARLEKKIYVWSLYGIPALAALLYAALFVYLALKP